MTEIRVGIIGLGRGRAHAEVFRMFEGVQVVAAYDLNPEIGRWGRERFDLEATYQELETFLAHDLNVVVVASPPMVHAEHAIAALEAGKHVLCEVPMIYSLDVNEALQQAETLTQAVLRAERASGARFMFAENTNYWWFVGDWERRIREGQLGKLTYLEVEYVHNCRSIMANADGSLTWRAHLPPIFYCTHSLGPALSFVGERPARVIGLSTGAQLAPEFPAPDMEVALITTEGGTIIRLLCGFKVAREPSHHWFSVYGTGGCLEMVKNQSRAVAHFEKGEPKRMSEIPFSLSHPNPPAGAEVGGHGTCEYFMIADFLRALREGLPMPIDVFDGLEMTLPGVFAHESAHNGGIPLDLPDFRARHGQA